MFFLVAAFFGQVGACIGYSALDIAVYKRVGVRRMCGVAGLVALEFVTLVGLWLATREHTAPGSGEPLDLSRFISEFILCGALGDFNFYWLHRALHAVPFLRNYVHAMHHDDGEGEPIMHSWVSLRVHPVEAFLIVVALFSPFLVFAHPAVLMAFAVFATVHAVTVHGGYEHGGFFLLGMPFLVSPRQHEVHHLSNTTKNFGNLLNIWDRLFDTAETPGAPKKPE
jgi:sterol desaturase/sphingolipid hydroxylase (fatty acid hydroxylase superfamily)